MSGTIPSNDAVAASGLDPESVFARYPKNSLMELFGYPAAPPAAFPFALVA
jgi:hypothetical protein